MAIIGTFTKSGDGYTGSLKTVTLSVKAKIMPTEKENDKAPDFRIFAGTTEFGAAWKKTSNAGREYLSVKLDDPRFCTGSLPNEARANGRKRSSNFWSVVVRRWGSGRSCTHGRGVSRPCSGPVAA